MTPTDPNAPAPSASLPAARPQGWWLPWVILTVSGVYLLSVFGRMSPPKEPANLNDFSRVPVVDTGRVKPLDTVARVKGPLSASAQVWVDTNPEVLRELARRHRDSVVPVVPSATEV